MRNENQFLIREFFICGLYCNRYMEMCAMLSVRPTTLKELVDLMTGELEFK